MNSLTSLEPEKLRRAADIVEKIQALEGELDKLLGRDTSDRVEIEESGPGRKKRKYTRQGFANIRAGARRGGEEKLEIGTVGLRARSSKRRTSPALRKARSEALTARWAARKAAGKTKL